MSLEVNGSGRDIDSESNGQVEETGTYLVPVQIDRGVGVPSRDDDSNNYFMSEPSVSEAESSGHVYAAHRLPNSRPFHRSAMQQPDEERRGVVSPHFATLPSPVPSSPGNTSLSSWESPAWRKGSVHVHFGPSSAKANSAISVKNISLKNTKEGRVVSVKNSDDDEKLQGLSSAASSLDRSGRSSGSQPPFPHVPNILVPRGFQERSSNSSGSLSSSRAQSADDFIEKLRGRSAGALEEAPDAYSLDDSALVGASVLSLARGADCNGYQGTEQLGKSASTDTDVMDNTQDGGEKSLPSSISGLALSHNSIDDSMAMTLSDDSESEEAELEATTLSRESQLDCDASYQTADDEKTTERPLRAKAASKPSSDRHRRQRSGDAAAATLVTGSKEWRGMEQDKIPFPDRDEDEDDQEMPRKRESRFSRQNRPELEHQTTGEDTGSSSKKRPSSHNHKAIPPRNPARHQTTRIGKLRTGRNTNNNSASDIGGDHQAFSSPDSPHRGIFFAAGLSPSGSDSSQHMQRLPESDASRSDSDGNPSARKAAHAYRSISNNANSTFHEPDPIREYQGTLQTDSQYGLSPFVNLGKTSTVKAPRSSFIPRMFEAEDEKRQFATYVCTVCHTRQRTFFSVGDAPQQVEGSSGYLALYFSIYVVSSLFIFGLEEGWKPLDCIYFAVITLTTAGLGDRVPTTDVNKIICSIFIYFGVACIGLLLGTYIAGMLDDRASREAKRNQVGSCPNCARLKTIQDNAMSNLSFRQGGSGKLKKAETIRGRSYPSQAPRKNEDAYFRPQRRLSKEDSIGVRTINSTVSGAEQSQRGLADVYTPPPTDRKMFAPDEKTTPGSVGSRATRMPVPLRQASVSSAANHLGSPVTQSILGRQKHTRHESFDINGKMFAVQRANVGQVRARKFSEDVGSSNFLPYAPAPTGCPDQDRLTSHMDPHFETGDATFAPVVGERSTSLRNIGYGRPNDSMRDSNDGYESSECSSSNSSFESADQPLDEKVFKMKAAKYVFLTLKQALVNSMVIIAVGCFGFWLVEEFSFVDSWYFATVLLTTVGYGDIVPVTRGGKLFATVYILVAGTILLNNMSLISMIPLELRKRRIERAVLTQFGDQLDDVALEELATGPVIQRLRLSEKRTNGLQECTREMFSLAMLVRLGKVSEQDIKQTFGAFRRLDVNDEGVLNSKSIIDGMVKKRLQTSQSTQNLHMQDEQDLPPPPPPPPSSSQQQQATMPYSATVIEAQQQYMMNEPVHPPPTSGGMPLSHNYAPHLPIGLPQDIHQPMLQGDHPPPTVSSNSPELLSPSFGCSTEVWNEQSALLVQQQPNNATTAAVTATNRSSYLVQQHQHHPFYGQQQQQQQYYYGTVPHLSTSYDDGSNHTGNYFPGPLPPPPPMTRNNSHESPF